MDADEKQIVRLCCTTASAVVIMLVTYFGMLYRHRQRPIPREPSAIRDLYKHTHMYRILNGSSSSCTDYLRMRKGTFFHLVKILRDSCLLQDTIHVSIEEQLAMFLHIVGHKSKNRVMRVDFIRSGETISRYFNKVLGAICILRDQYMKPTPNETPLEVESSSLWYPYFSDCIGLIDATHIDATVPTEYVARFRSRKGTTQNVLAAALPNKLFTYVLAGWEGSTNDFTVLKDALSLPPPNGLRVYDGKYYLCDVGYTTMPGFLSPYQSVRYHLKEQAGRTPKNRRELFNQRHSSLRIKIEYTFGILKNRFKILSGKPHHPFPTQVDIVLACTVLHNYIAITDPIHDRFLNEEVPIVEEQGDTMNEDDDSTSIFSSTMTDREQIEARNEWQQKRDQIAWEMWVDYCNMYNRGDTTESNIEEL